MMVLSSRVSIAAAAAILLVAVTAIQGALAWSPSSKFAGGLPRTCNTSTSGPEDRGLSWCKFRNPFILSDFLSRNSTDLTVRDTTNHSAVAGNNQTFSVSYNCVKVPGHRHRVCGAIKQIRTTSIGSITKQDISRYVIFTDRDGQLLFVHFNNNTMASALTSPIANVSLFDVTETQRSVGEEVLQDAVFLVGNATTLSLEAISSDGATRGDGSNQSVCTLFESPGLDNYFLEQAQFYPRSGNTSVLKHLLYAFGGVTEWLDPRTGANRTVYFYNAFFSPTNSSTIVGYVRSSDCGKTLPLGVQLYARTDALVPLKFAVYHNIAGNVTLYFAYSDRVINAFRVEYYKGQPSNWSTTNHSSFELDFEFDDYCDAETNGDTHWVHNRTTGVWTNVTRRRPSTVFCAPVGTTISSLEVFSPDTWTDIGPFARDYWLTMGLRNATGSYVHVVDLMEMTWVPDANSTIFNPLGLPSTFGTPDFPCKDFRRFAWDPYLEDCVPRFVEQLQLESAGPVESIVGRAIEDGMNDPHTNTENASTAAPVPTTPAAPENNHAFGGGGSAVPLPYVTKPHATIFVAQGRSVTVLSLYSANESASARRASKDPPPLLLQFENSIRFQGNVSFMEASPNAQHLFAAVTREEWEIDALWRYVDICGRIDAAAANKKNGAADDPFLQDFVDVCKNQPAQPVSLNSFTQYSSLCTMNVYCPTLDRLQVEFPPQRYYAERPAVQRLCPVGSFCTAGQKIECPPGFFCDERGLDTPKRCTEADDFNVTCATSGLVEPMACPEGNVCLVTHIPGMPAPPGEMVPAPSPGTKRSDFLPCPLGDWCPIGRQQPFNNSAITAEMLECPAYSFCVNSTVLAPTVCQCVGGNISDGRGGFVACDDRIPYCPPRTINVSWCPAGHYCTSPNATVACVPTQYCPPGTFAPELCPAGRYCPDPAASLECPDRHYCPRGTVEPIECNFLTVCKPGSEAQSSSFAAPFVILSIIAGVMGATYGFNWYKARHMAQAQAVKYEVAPAVFATENGDWAILDDGGPPTTTTTTSAATIDAAAAAATKNDSIAAERHELTSPLNNTSSSSAAGGGGSAIPTSAFPTPHIEFEGMGLSLTVGSAKGKKVLDNVTGSIPPGSFVAVMGPSGSGKSTFMHTLAGKAFYGTRLGRVTVNGDEVNLTEFSKVVGFVKQDDIMMREMTVAETLLFNARMRYDPSCGHRPEAIANAMCTALDLDHVRDTAIGDEKKRGISGGQRKRVNIGMEMTALPSVLFLDEPTSGLDSSSSMVVCGALRKMAQEGGITIIAVIHQPRYEIFQMFHKVLLLAKGGKLVYNGAPQSALGYFERDLGLTCPDHVNPPDFMMDVISGDAAGITIDEMADKWRASMFNESSASFDFDAVRSASPNLPAPPASTTSMNGSVSTTATTANFDGRAPRRQTGAELAALAKQRRMPGFFAQVKFFLLRSLTQIARDILWFFIDIGLVFVSGFFLGLVFSQSKYRPPLPDQIVNKSLSAFDGNAPADLRQFFDRPIDDPIISQASLTCMAIGMTGVTAALRVFGNEQIVYWREASGGMSTTAYFVAKNLSHVFFIVLSPILYTAPFLTFVSTRASFFDFYRVALIVQFTTTGLGYLISLVAPPGLSQLGGVVVVLVFSMFGGARPTLVEIKKMFVLLRIMPYTSYIRWAQEALYLQELDEWRGIEGVNVEPSLKLFDYEFGDYGLCVGLTLAFGVGFRVLALVAMIVMNREQKH